MEEMKTVNFRDDLLKPIAYELGIDPDSSDLNNDHAAAWTSFINRYVRQGWEAWDFPELDVTEERAFRPIWSSSKQFRRVGLNNGQPDELLYIPDLVAGNNPYYQVLSTAPTDPPVGTLPTNTTYFQPLVLVDKYIAYDQQCRQTIGRVIGIYGSNPRMFTNSSGVKTSFRRLSYKPSEKGIDVHHTAKYTVWVKFQMVPSQFTSKQYSSTTTYNKGDLAYDPTTGNVYRAVVVTTNNPPGSSSWMVVPLPYTLQLFAIYAAASCASEDIVEQQNLMGKAQECLGREIDKLIEQGQRFPTYRTGFARKRHFGEWAVIDPTIGDDSPSSVVTTLTDICQDPWGNVAMQDIDTLVQAAVTAIPSGQDYVDITFSQGMVDSAGNPTSNWEFLELTVEYPTDPPPGKIAPDVVTNKLTTGGRVYLTAATPDGSYTLRWKALGSGVVTV